ncbi:MAG: type II toxin-antitoxin system VapC family toxin [Anaerolineae bacterium]
MIANTPAYVVDASVGIKLFVNEPLAEQAAALFARLAATPPAQLFVPDLFFIECTNILWKYVHRSGYPPETARANLSELNRLSLRGIPTSELTAQALEIAVAQVITAYDACYVALARDLGIPFITADEVLVRKLKNSPFDVRWLPELEDRPS